MPIVSFIVFDCFTLQNHFKCKGWALNFAWKLSFKMLSVYKYIWLLSGSYKLNQLITIMLLRFLIYVYLYYVYICIYYLCISWSCIKVDPWFIVMKWFLLFNLTFVKLLQNSNQNKITKFDDFHSPEIKRLLYFAIFLYKQPFVIWFACIHKRVWILNITIANTTLIKWNEIFGFCE